MNTELAIRLDAAMAATKPFTKARNKALASVKWVLMCADGYASLSEQARCIIVPDLCDAMVFDGRDNEERKVATYSAALGTEFVVELLPCAS